MKVTRAFELKAEREAAGQAEIERKQQVAIERALNKERKERELIEQKAKQERKRLERQAAKAAKRAAREVAKQQREE